MTIAISPLSAIQHTDPDVFILESLDEEDEDTDRCEGAFLAQVLRFSGKHPTYRYFRTEKELRHFAEEFEASKCRFLHLSCHGDLQGFQLRFDDVGFDAFAAIFDGKLQHRRLFISSCQSGNRELVEQVIKANPRMYSILAPTDKINRDHAVAIWAAFYVKVFDVDARRVKRLTIKQTMRTLCNLFGVTFSWSYYDSVDDEWRHSLIEPRKRVQWPERDVEESGQPPAEDNQPSPAETGSSPAEDAVASITDGAPPASAFSSGG